jgi:hypothetical protein
VLAEVPSTHERERIIESWMSLRLVPDLHMDSHDRNVMKCLLSRRGAILLARPVRSNTFDY